MCQQGHAEANWPDSPPDQERWPWVELSKRDAELAALRAEVERLREENDDLRKVVATVSYSSGTVSAELVAAARAALEGKE